MQQLNRKYRAIRDGYDCWQVQRKYFGFLWIGKMQWWWCSQAEAERRLASLNEVIV